MAKIKIKFGQNEIEIDSRDFYVDNQTLGEVINNITNHIEENQARLNYEEQSSTNPYQTSDETYQTSDETYQTGLNYLKSLDNAEVHEPEYSEPVPIIAEEIKDKLKILEKDSFFNTPRTVSETVSQLREYGWSTSALQVSKVLAQMAFNKELLKNSRENRSYYIAKTAVLTN